MIVIILRLWVAVGGAGLCQFSGDEPVENLVPLAAVVLSSEIPQVLNAESFDLYRLRWNIFNRFQI